MNNNIYTQESHLLTEILSKKGSEKTKSMSFEEISDEKFLKTTNYLTELDKRKIRVIKEQYDVIYNQVRVVEKINSPTDAFEIAKGIFTTDQQEEFHLIFLNTKLEVIDTQLMFKGTVDRTIVSARDIFRVALEKGAVNIIATHNHPSGHTDPSDEDIKVTRDIAKFGELIGIELIDHVIVGSNTNKFISLKEIGVF